MKAILSLAVGCVASLALAVEPPKPEPPKTPEPVIITDKHFAVFDARGNPSNLDALVEKMSGVSVVFLGEHHDDPVAHHLQTLLLKRATELAAKTARPPGTTARPVVLALEMFERDVQSILDEYLDGLITEQHFMDASRPWKHYVKDYRPLVEFARENKLAVLASNAPRRYVNRVNRLGAASLKDIADPTRRGLPPLPYAEASPVYSAKFHDLMKNAHKPAKKEEAEPPKDLPVEKPEVKKPEEKKPAGATHNVGRGLEAQSLWDAAMAYTIAEHLMRQPRAQIVHLNGSFHSEQRLGIPEHLLRYRPGTSLLVVTMLPHKSFPRFEVSDMADRGDFVIVTDASLPRSYSATTK